MKIVLSDFGDDSGDDELPAFLGGQVSHAGGALRVAKSFPNVEFPGYVRTDAEVTQWVGEFCSGGNFELIFDGSASAILDRFLQSAEIMKITGRSYRLKNAEKSSKGAEAPTGSTAEETP